MVLENLEPKLVWDLFENVIAKTPRPSKHEEFIRDKIKNYLKDKEKLLGIQFDITQDNVGNILIKKPANPDMVRCPPIMLQAHLDMVCETNRIEGYDFLNKGIPIRIQSNNEWIDASGTSLGADNGIGLALALAILIDPNFKLHGPIEVLFTVNEEDGFDGAALLDPKSLDIKSKLMINLDGGPLGEIVIGSVGGRRVRFSKKFNWIEPKQTDNFQFYAISVDGLLSGHSGEDIKLPRANANKLVSRILSSISQEIKLCISSWKGGSKANVIPAKAFVKFAINLKHRERLEEIVNNEILQISEYYNKFEPNLKLIFNKDYPNNYLSTEDSNILISTVNIIPHGILKMSFSYPDHVESSNNLAIINTEIDNEIIWLYPRSLIRSELETFCISMNQLGDLGGWKVFLRPVLPEWLPDSKSKFLSYIKKQYNTLLKTPVKTNIVHGGLETGMISTRLTGLQMVSIGPTMEGLHSPRERVKISDVEILYHLLKKILSNTKELMM